VNAKRETVAAALLTLLQGATIAGITGLTQFVTISRATTPWSNITPGDQPAIYVIHSGEQLMQNQAYGLTKYCLHYELVIYARADASPAAVPDTLINALLDSIDAVMQSTPPGERQTLGGVVYHAWIEGEILIDSGILDEQIAILVPIKVLTGI
jgi:hypothetical protein